jgi:hypothetical protein
MALTPLEIRLAAIEDAISELADRQRGIFSAQQFAARNPALAPFAQRLRERQDAERAARPAKPPINIRERYRPVFAE